MPPCPAFATRIKLVLAAHTQAHTTGTQSGARTAGTHATAPGMAWVRPMVVCPRAVQAVYCMSAARVFSCSETYARFCACLAVCSPPPNSLASALSTSPFETSPHSLRLRQEETSFHGVTHDQLKQLQFFQLQRRRLMQQRAELEATISQSRSPRAPHTAGFSSEHLPSYNEASSAMSTSSGHVDSVCTGNLPPTMANTHTTPIMSFGSGNVAGFTEF